MFVRVNTLTNNSQVLILDNGEEIKGWQRVFKKISFHSQYSSILY